MYTEAELDDAFDSVNADECAEMRSTFELGYSVAALSAHFEFEEAAVRHHLDDCCSHY